MNSNEIRTENARAALEHYRQLQSANGEFEFAVIDIVTDILHLAAHEGLDPHAVAQKAELHYRAEAFKLHAVAEVKSTLRGQAAPSGQKSGMFKG